MNYGLYISAAGLRAQQERQAVTSNNLANARTAGFKRDLVAMQSRANASMEDPKMFAFRLPVVKDQGGGVFAEGNGIDLSQAVLELTANHTDMALEGEGFFTVQGKDGEKLLTRDGRFMINREGKLVMSSGGRAVLDDAGSEITLNPDLPVKVQSNGELVQGNVAVGKLGLVGVTDPRQVMKLGGNVMRAAPNALKEVSPATTVRHYALEASGVDPMVELINMMEGQRAFEANARMITMNDQTMAQLNQIGRVV